MDSNKVLGSFIKSFGKPRDVLAHLTEDATWTLHTGSQAPGGTYAGKDAIEELMNSVFGGIYNPESCFTDIQQIITDQNQGAVRFQLTATTTWGVSYSTPYAIFVRFKDLKICECHELLDSLSATEQLASTAPESLKSE